MNSYRKNMTAALCIAGMLVIIFDSRAAISAAEEGVRLCLETVIPSLFPFFILTVPITQFLWGRKLSRKFAKRLGVPAGSEGLLLVGMLGGYPMGPKAVASAYQAGCICRQDAKRMLCFSGYAGPAFLFGMAARAFPNTFCIIPIWLIHLSTGIMIAGFLPGKSNRQAVIPQSDSASAMNSSLRAMAAVCGWVILFRVLLSFAERWVLWLFPISVQVLFSGIMELTNGILLLSNISSIGCRFTLAAIILGFGGICVAMQTSSVTEDLGIDTYLKGKILQSILSGLLAYAYQFMFFSGGDRWIIPGYIFIPVIASLIVGCFFVFWQKKSRYSSPVPV